MSGLRSSPTVLKDPDDNYSYRLLVGDVERLDNQLSADESTIKTLQSNVTTLQNKPTTAAFRTTGGIFRMTSQTTMGSFSSVFTTSWLYTSMPVSYYPGSGKSVCGIDPFTYDLSPGWWQCNCSLLVDFPILPTGGTTQYITGSISSTGGTYGRKAYTSPMPVIFSVGALYPIAMSMTQYFTASSGNSFSVQVANGTNQSCQWGDSGSDYLSLTYLGP